MHHDNTPAHTPMLVPYYSLELVNTEFILFPKLKATMKGKLFAEIEKIEGKSKQELLAILASTFRGLVKTLA